MHPMVIAVYRKKNPSRPKGDVMVWHRDVGFLVPEESLVHGHVLWALSEGREGKLRVEMRYCEPLRKIVFREKFVRRSKPFIPWPTVKESIKQFFKGPKPEYVSWKTAKAMMKKAGEGKENDCWHSLREHRAGTAALLSKAPAFLHA